MGRDDVPTWLRAPDQSGTTQIYQSTVKQNIGLRVHTLTFRRNWTSFPEAINTSSHWCLSPHSYKQQQCLYNLKNTAWQQICVYRLMIFAGLYSWLWDCSTEVTILPSLLHFISDTTNNVNLLIIYQLQLSLMLSRPTWW